MLGTKLPVAAAEFLVGFHRDAGLGCSGQSAGTTSESLSGLYNRRSVDRTFQAAGRPEEPLEGLGRRHCESSGQCA